MKRSSTVFTSLSPAEPTEVYDAYWRFAAERQAIFFRRLNGERYPWTQDHILAKYKFTNAYRASDRVSQYLIKKVIYSTEQTIADLFFRIILFKIFNRIETWELLEKEVGTISYSDYKFKTYDKVLSKAKNENTRIYSAAYIMPSGNSAFGYSQKHRNHLRMLESMMNDELPARIQQARSLQQVFELLRSYPMMGDFLAYQYAIDLNYSTLIDFDEMEFVVPGPGAKNGIRKCFQALGGLTEANIIQLMVDRQQEEFIRLGLEFKNLWSRDLRLIDCQNLFCEIDKYARMAYPEINEAGGRTRIKQYYRPNFNNVSYWYPPKWNINNKIEIVGSSNNDT